MAKNPILIVNNAIKTLILKFIRRFYQPELTYTDKLIKQWVDNLIRWFIDILFNGFVGYLALFGLTYLFPALNNKIFLGDNLFYLPFTIVLIGIVSWFVFNFLKIIPPIIKITTRG